MTITGMKAAILCRARRGEEAELKRQQQLLEHFADSNRLEIVSCYLDDDEGALPMQNDVLLHLAQAARRHEFELIIIESTSKLPDFQNANVPRLNIYAVAEDKLITVDSSGLDAIADIPERVFQAYPYLPNK